MSATSHALSDISFVLKLVFIFILYDILRMCSYIWFPEQSLCVSPAPQSIVLQLVSSAFDFQTELYCYVISICLYSLFKQIEVYVCPPIPQRIVLQLVSSKFQLSVVVHCCLIVFVFVLFDVWLFMNMFLPVGPISTRFSLILCGLTSCCLRQCCVLPVCSCLNFKCK